MNDPAFIEWIEKNAYFINGAWNTIDGQNIGITREQLYSLFYWGGGKK